MQIPADEFDGDDSIRTSARTHPLECHRHETDSSAGLPPQEVRSSTLRTPPEARHCSSSLRHVSQI